MAPVDIPDPTTEHRRPFRALEDSFTRWTTRANAGVDGSDPGEPLIGGDLRGSSPRATITLIGAGGSQSRGGTLIGTSGMRAPLDPVSPAGSGGAPLRAVDDGDHDHDSTIRAGRRRTDAPADLDHDLLVSLAADRERLADIARALGACPACWGERIGCPRCGGVGRPGAEDPRPEAFDRYVRPLLARLQATGTEVRPRRRPPGSEAHPAGRGADDAAPTRRPGPRIAPRRDRAR